MTSSYFVYQGCGVGRGTLLLNIENKQQLYWGGYVAVSFANRVEGQWGWEEEENKKDGN